MKTISISKWVAVVAMIFIGAVPAFAQVTRNLGTIPPGGTVTITFDVTINPSFPANTASVTNQGSVTGTGFGPILTDDPTTLTANDPTVPAGSGAPQIPCPPDITTNGFIACSLPAIAFAASA